MTEKQNKIALVFATIILFVALVVLILVVIPKVSQLKDLSNQVESKKIEYDVGKIKVENASALASMISQYQIQAQTLGIALPSSGKAEDALVEISAASGAAGLRITSAEEQTDNKGNLQVNLSTKGSYGSSVNFFGKLRDNLRPVKILNMSMTKVDNDITTDFTLVFPFFVQPSISTTQVSDNSQGVK